ncbi:hypothetical protein DH2020_039627 [Rehmannia glutinosa]|uniref:Uncharacterized protein n=1 Tax=Rehmannia glutinosa TaxID=99300 RepID=A0ABR0UWG7_REHGL
MDGTNRYRAHNRKRRQKLFRFESRWSEFNECAYIIKTSWTRNEHRTSFGDKLRDCSMALKHWDKKTFGGNRERIEKLKTRLEEIQKSTQTEGAIEEGKIIEAELDDLYKLEETFCHQRSRALWIKLGDRNTGFFHRKASQRQARNSILKLQQDDGNWAEEEHELVGVLTDYFENLFTFVANTDTHKVLETVEPKVSPQMNESL